MSVQGQGQMQKKMLNFTLRQFFVARKKVHCTLGDNTGFAVIFLPDPSSKLKPS